MSRLFDDGSSEHLQIEQAIIAAYPYAMACWFQADDDTAVLTLMWVGDKDSETYFSALYADGGIGGDPVGFLTKQYGESNAPYITTTAGFTANSWHHAASISLSTTERHVYIDGSNKASNTDAVGAMANHDRVAIGAMRDSSPGGYMSGMIAEAAIWNLTDWGVNDAAREANFEKALASMAKGFSPSCFPLGLVAHWPLIRGLNDKVGGFNLAATGTVVSTQPKIFNLINPLFISKGLIVLAGTSTENLTAISSLNVDTGLGSSVVEIVGVSATLSDLDVLTLLSVFATGTANLFGLLDLQSGLTGAITGTVTAFSSLNVDTELQSSTVGAATVTGTLSIPTINLMGSSDGASNIVGSLTVGTGVLSIGIGTSTVIGSLSVNTELQSAVIAESEVSGWFGLWIFIAGIVDAASGFISGMLSEKGLEGTTIGVGDSSGYLTLIPDFEAAILFWRPQNRIIETLKWKTSVLKANDGTEQRIKIRRSPRQYFKLRIFLGTNELNSWYDSLIHTWQKQAWLIPIWNEYVTHTGDINIKDDTITVDTTFADFRNNSKAIIWKSATEYEVVAVTAKTDNILFLSYPILSAFSGSKYIMPVRKAYLTTRSKKTRNNAEGAFIDLIFSVYDNTNITGHVKENNYNNIDLLINPAYMDKGHLEESDADITVFDFETGIFKTESNSNFNFLTQNHNFFNDTKEACWNFRQFLYSLSGRQKSILIPTFRSDMVQTETIGLTDTTVKIRNIRLTENMGYNPLRTYIGFYFPDNTLIVRKINGITRLNSTEEQISFDYNLDLNLDVEIGDCKICFVDKCRLASDEIELRWPYAHRNECKTNFMRVS